MKTQKITLMALCLMLGGCAMDLLVPGERYRVERCLPAYDRALNQGGYLCRCRSTAWPSASVTVFVPDSMATGSFAVFEKHTDHGANNSNN